MDEVSATLLRDILVKETKKKIELGVHRDVAQVEVIMEIDSSMQTFFQNLDFYIGREC